MSVLLCIVLTLIAIAATAVVMVDDPLRQSMLLGFYGMLLAAAFFILQAPDVALSMIVVAGALVPALVLLALARIRRLEDDDGGDE